MIEIWRKELEFVRGDREEVYERRETKDLGVAARPFASRQQVDDSGHDER